MIIIINNNIILIYPPYSDASLPWPFSALQRLLYPPQHLLEPLPCPLVDRPGCIILIWLDCGCSSDCSKNKEFTILPAAPPEPGLPPAPPPPYCACISAILLALIAASSASSMVVVVGCYDMY